MHVAGQRYNAFAACPEPLEVGRGKAASPAARGALVAATSGGGWRAMLPRRSDWAPMVPSAACEGVLVSAVLEPQPTPRHLIGTASTPASSHRNRPPSPSTGPHPSPSTPENSGNTFWGIECTCDADDDRRTTSADGAPRTLIRHRLVLRAAAVGAVAATPSDGGGRPRSMRREALWLPPNKTTNDSSGLYRAVCRSPAGPSTATTVAVPARLVGPSIDGICFVPAHAYRQPQSASHSHGGHSSRSAAAPESTVLKDAPAAVWTAWSRQRSDRYSVPPPASTASVTDTSTPAAARGAPWHYTLDVAQAGLQSLHIFDAQRRTVQHHVPLPAHLDGVHRMLGHGTAMSPHHSSNKTKQNVVVSTGPTVDGPACVDIPSGGGYNGSIPPLRIACSLRAERVLTVHHVVVDGTLRPVVCAWTLHSPYRLTHFLMLPFAVPLAPGDGTTTTSEGPDVVGIGDFARAARSVQRNGPALIMADLFDDSGAPSAHGTRLVCVFYTMQAVVVRVGVPTDEAGGRTPLLEVVHSVSAAEGLRLLVAAPGVFRLRADGHAALRAPTAEELDTLWAADSAAAQALEDDGRAARPRTPSRKPPVPTHRNRGTLDADAHRSEGQPPLWQARATLHGYHRRRELAYYLAAVLAARAEAAAPTAIIVPKERHHRRSRRLHASPTRAVAAGPYAHPSTHTGGPVEPRGVIALVHPAASKPAAGMADPGTGPAAHATALMPLRAHSPAALAPFDRAVAAMGRMRALALLRRYYHQWGALAASPHRVEWSGRVAVGPEHQPARTLLIVPLSLLCGGLFNAVGAGPSPLAAALHSAEDSQLGQQGLAATLLPPEQHHAVRRFLGACRRAAVGVWVCVPEDTLRAMGTAAAALRGGHRVTFTQVLGALLRDLDADTRVLGSTCALPTLGHGRRAHQHRTLLQPPITGSGHLPHRDADLAAALRDTVVLSGLPSGCDAVALLPSVFNMQCTRFVLPPPHASHSHGRQPAEAQRLFVPCNWCSDAHRTAFLAAAQALVEDAAASERDSDSSDDDGGAGPAGQGFLQRYVSRCIAAAGAHTSAGLWPCSPRASMAHAATLRPVLERSISGKETLTLWGL